MKYLFLSFYLVLISYCLSAQNIINPENWEFRQAGTLKWYKASVPGCVHTDLLSSGLINDPFYRTNEDNLQWIDKVNWEYKSTFRIPEQLDNADEIMLVFEGIDTYADIYLNSVKIHSNQNMFTGIDIPIDKALLKETNEIRLYFNSPVKVGLEKLESYGLPLPADNDQSEKGGLGPNKVSIFTRKAPYQFGWDWGPRLVTSGVWRPVYIRLINKAIIEDVQIKQNELSSKVASLTANITLKLPVKQSYNLTLLVNGTKVAEQNISPDTRVLQSPLQNKYDAPINFIINEPQLWWPNGHGKQPLYAVTIELSSDNKLIDSETVPIGLRTIKLIRKPDKDGESFYFEVNGKPVFAKGANYIPNDVFPSRVDTLKYESIISSAAKANMNMLRVWGGGIYEDNLFYRLCDKYGIMVWQDFMFACAMYPGNKEFLEQVNEEAEYNIKRLRNHPCIVLWCGNNEIEQAWGQYEENRGWGWKQRYNAEERNIIWKAYDTVFHYILPEKVKNLSPETPYWHSSPSAAMGKLAGHANTSGDMHYWGVWHGNEPIESYKKYKARFMSEYGFQSFPEFESVKNYTSVEDWNINSPVMLSHQRSMIGNQRIRDYLSNWYNQPKYFEDLLYVSQLLQAEAMKIAIEAHRTSMPYCMGSLYWQLNDCWPVASWSGIDYYGRWKALHYFAKEAFKNQILSVDQTEKEIKIFGVSDIEGSKASLRINLMDFKGNSLWNRIIQVKLNPNTSTLLTTIDLSKLPAIQYKKDALISLSLIKGDRIIDTEIHYLDKPKNLELPFPEVNMHIRQKQGKFDIEISSKYLCKNLMLISEGNAYSFPENYFDILPGETKTVTVVSDLPFNEFERKLSYTHLQQACQK